MIAKVAADVGELLRARKFPIKRIEYGPEPFERCPNHTAVIMARDVGSGDRFDAPIGVAVRGHVSQNGRKMATRYVGGECWVLAKASRPHATHADHEYLADQIVDGLQCALYRWASEHKTRVELTGGAVVYGAELPGTFERFPGVIYRFRFTVARGVPDSDYDGAGLPTVELDAVDTGSTIATVAADSETGPDQEAR
jgi:hypothetical protein